MKTPLGWLVPILESFIASVLHARYQVAARDEQVDLEEAYEHMMRARTAISRFVRTAQRRERSN